MPKPTFFALPAERRDRLVREAIAEFSERSYADASLSQIAQRSHIPKGSFYQYFEDKVDLYRWLVTEEAPRHKREFLAASGASKGDYWADFEALIERGMAFLVEHPRLARLTAAAADPTASAEVRGLHRAICEAGIDEFRLLLERGIEEGAMRPGLDLDVAARLVAAVVGPGLTDVVLRELGADLHEVLASDALRKKLGPTRRRRLAQQAVLLIHGGLGAATSKEKGRKP
jgi:AcrR family transcriptional regulator